ncbi:hypothetical protein [Prauserella cavernicola]|uniref:Uncharacterized protein n=1 Tax=Prauserella cavernicola TaxID=2800127 RepID=A0A934V3X8_9PSEU|nr:hypothetical protein [Prauserella cavernicola]MBK1783520.1 hypothetical protein [Prauserella cavernicola]
MSHRAEVVTVPAEFVGRPGNLPRHCSRHGEPAVQHKDFLLQSKVKIQGSRFGQVQGRGALAMAERLDQHGKKVRVAEVKGWPLCRRCVRTRARWLAVACVFFLGGLALFAGSLIVAAVTDGMPWLAGVAVAGFALMPLSAFPFVRGSMSRLIGARASDDGSAVLIENPSRAFAAELPTTR